MVKQLMDMCLGCIAQNLHAISNVGKHLPTLHKEKILQWVVDHNMLTTEYVPHVTYHLFSPALRSISFNDCDQITDKLLIQLDACKCVLESITIDGCKVTGRCRCRSFSNLSHTKKPTPQSHYKTNTKATENQQNLDIQSKICFQFGVSLLVTVLTI